MFVFCLRESEVLSWNIVKKKKVKLAFFFYINFIQNQASLIRYTVDTNYIVI